MAACSGADAGTAERGAAVHPVCPLGGGVRPDPLGGTVAFAPSLAGCESDAASGVGLRRDAGGMPCVLAQTGEVSHVLEHTDGGTW